MQYKDYAQKFNGYKKYIPTEKEIKTLIMNINKCIPIVQALINKYKIKDAEKLPDAVDYLISLISDDYTKTAYIDSRLYELQAMEHILKNPNIIKKELPNIQNTPNTHIMYTANRNRSQKLVLVNALDELHQFEDIAEQFGITAKTKVENVRINAEDPQYMRKILKLIITILNQNTIENKLITVLQFQKTNCEEFIRENQINSLKFLHDTLNMFGNINAYLNLYNANKVKFGFSDLNYELDNTESSKDISITQAFSEDFLNSLSINELCFFNTFWCNRFAKECSQLHTAFCAINSLNLWDHILNGKTKFNISDEILTAVIRKDNFLTNILSDSFDLHQNNIYSSELKNGENAYDTVNLKKDYTPYYKKLHTKLQDEYSAFFSNSSLPNNSFLYDANFAAPFVNLERYVYRKKETTLEPLIKELLDNNHCKNWGIVREELVNGSYVDALSLNKPLVLFACDIEGFNMPFRFHISKDSLMDLTKLANGDYLIPEYQGHNDFISFNTDENRLEAIPTNIMMPINKSHRAIISEHSNTDEKNKNFWEHIYFLMNGKFPKHLTVTKKKGKKDLQATRLPIHYTDLSTGKSFVKIKDKYIEVDDSNER